VDATVTPPQSNSIWPVARRSLRVGVASACPGSVTERKHSERWVLAGLVAVLVAQLAAAAAIIPPWQGPDEPQHVFQITLLARGYPLQTTAETAIVTSMYRNSWWEHYQRPRPDVAPTTFLDGPAKVTDVKGAPGGPLLFHVAAGALFRAAGIENVERQFWWLRFSSAAFGALTFGVLYVANRVMFGVEAALTSAAIVALQPQFVLVHLSANPDAIVALLGALLWLSAVLVVRRSGIGAAVVLAWACAILGVLIRRVAFPLLFDATIVSALAIAYGRSRRLIVGALSVGLVVLSAGTWLMAWEHAQAAARWIADVLTPLEAIRGALADPAFTSLLARVLFKSYWLTAGWMRYEAPAWWYAVLVLVGLIALVGCGRLLRVDAAQPQVRVALVVASVFVLVQIVAVFVAYIPLRAGVQGRYLMPVIGPAAGLMATGLVHGWHLGTPQQRKTSTMVLFATTNVLAWVLVLLPTYAWS
jgi:Predicted membrane protein (DUF2142)